MKIVGKLTANGTGFSGRPFFRGNFEASNCQSCGSDLYHIWEEITDAPNAPFTFQIRCFISKP